jgi:hypothetical protein
MKNGRGLGARILQGEFKWIGRGKMEIQVESCSVEFCLDSKRFYQPNCQFACVINEEEGVIVIPAIQKRIMGTVLYRKHLAKCSMCAETVRT